MTKREKVVLIMMALAVVYGAYIFLYSSQSRINASKPGGGSGDLNEFVIDVAKKITDKNLSRPDYYIAEQAAAEWTKNPFLGPELPVKLEIITVPDPADRDRMETSTREVSFSYSGYLKIGDKSLAIVNGIEYEAGETLGKPGYFVRGIFPTWIEIGVAGEANNIILPLEESYNPVSEKDNGKKNGFDLSEKTNAAQIGADRIGPAGIRPAGIRFDE